MRAKPEWFLIAAILIECLLFSLLANHFFTVENFFEIVRLSVELGLLALALTCVIATGGIDLSVGSLMSLCAVTFGALFQDFGFPWLASALLAIAVGLLGGALNAFLVARFRIPPLIVTLGSYSLFRGLAEGITRGIANYSGFPPSFSFLGQGYFGGWAPAQAPLLVAAAAFFYVLLHRTIIGRAWIAIGYSPQGALFAGLPVSKRLAQVYVLSGLTAGVAAMVYVAHLGQAKSDAGSGYELMAITAVVLGGTSIFGGRATIVGSLLGLAAIVMLQNGLRLAGEPAELAGVLTGVLLIAAIVRERFGEGTPVEQKETSTLRNSQLAILCATILAAALLIAGSNWMLVRSVMPAPSSRSSLPSASTRTVAMMPKAKGDPYFVSCRQGAEEAAKERGVNLLWDGPTDLDPAKQNEVVEAWITRGVDAIAVSVENRAGISTVLRKARARGIPVIAWDADAEPDARDFFINQATPQGIGFALADRTASLLHESGEFAIVTASLSAANQNEWIRYLKERVAAKHPKLHLAVIRPSDGDRDRAFAETQTILKAYPAVRVIVGVATPAVPGAAEAVQQARRADVKVIGLSLPNLCKPWVHSGEIESVVLWNTRDLGYLTVSAADAVAGKQLSVGARTFQAGRLGAIEVQGDQVILGEPFIFNKQNIDQFNF